MCLITELRSKYSNENEAVEDREKAKEYSRWIVDFKT